VPILRFIVLQDAGTYTIPAGTWHRVRACGMEAFSGSLLYTDIVRATVPAPYSLSGGMATPVPLCPGVPYGGVGSNAPVMQTVPIDLWLPPGTTYAAHCGVNTIATIAIEEYTEEEHHHATT